MLHCSPSTETKLKSIAKHEAVASTLWKSLAWSSCKLLQKAFFKQDGPKQAIVKIIEANKQLIFCWKNQGMTLNIYTRDFNAKIDVCKVVRSAIRVNEAATRLTYASALENYDALSSL